MASDKSRVQGEGDYEAARRFRKRSESFIASHDVTAEARKAAPVNADEAREMADAEKRGRARAKKKGRSH